MEFAHVHRETAVLVTFRGTGEEGTGLFWGTPMKGWDNLPQTTYQKTAGPPVIPLRSTGGSYPYSSFTATVFMQGHKHRQQR